MRAFRLPSVTLLRENSAFQIGLIVLFWFTGEAAARFLSLPIPGSVIGMFLVLGLLTTGRFRASSIQRGAQWLIGEMLLFFVPAVLAVLDHREFLSLLGIKILAVIVTGTIVVMCTTALSVELALRLASNIGTSANDDR